MAPSMCIHYHKGQGLPLVIRVGSHPLAQYFGFLTFNKAWSKMWIYGKDIGLWEGYAIEFILDYYNIPRLWLGYASVYYAH